MSLVNDETIRKPHEPEYSDVEGAVKYMDGSGLSRPFTFHGPLTR